MKKIINKNGRHPPRAGALLAASLLIAGACLAGCGTSRGEEGRLKVAADIFPMADLCRRIGGDLVEVETMVPPGTNPHAFELTTGQMRFLSEADVLVTVGLDLTPWAEGIFEKAGNPDLVVVKAGESLPEEDLIPALDDVGHGDEGGHGVHDPHVWLDPELAALMVEAISGAFAAADPANSETYESNAAACVEELRRLDAHIRDEVAGFRARKFVSFHSSWVYFARRYGLEQVGVIEELPGKEPSAGEIAELVEMIRAQGVTAVFAEPQYSSRAAEAVAESAGGGVTVVTVDPLGDPEDPEADSYVEMMKRAVRAMGEALK